MPKTKIDYSKTIIYKIACKDVNIKQTYGGHTTNIIKRRNCHKSICNNINSKDYNVYIYKFIRDNGGWDNWEMLWCYDFPCNSKREALLEERNFIEKEKCELNSSRPYITEEENKETHKKWIDENKNKILEKQKKYNEEHKENIKEYQKDYQKIYKKKNKDKIKEYNKKYNKKWIEENKDEISAKKKIKYTCMVCGSTLRIADKSRHEKSKKHLKYCEKI